MIVPFMRTGWMVMAADAAIKLRFAATASGTPIECPPPSTSDTVGFVMPAISSRDGKSGLDVAAHRVEQHEQTVYLLLLLDRRNLRNEVLVFCRLVLRGQLHVSLDLSDDGDAVHGPRAVRAVMEPVSAMLLRSGAGTAVISSAISAFSSLRVFCLSASVFHRLPRFMYTVSSTKYYRG